METSRTFVRSPIAPDRTFIRIVFSLFLFFPICGCGGIAQVAPSNPDTPSNAIAVFGDSLTCGGQGNAYGQSPVGSVPFTLQSLLGIPVVNQGVNGDTSSQIAVRYNAGGSNQVLTLSGNRIPTSGSVQVSFSDGWEPVTASGGNNGGGCYQSLTGIGTNATLNGIPGVFTYSGGEYYFTPTTSPSSPVSTATNNPYTVASPYAGYFLVDSSGTNDFHNGIPPVSASIANDLAMTALAGNRYIVTSALPFIYSSYWIGGPDAIALANLNAAKASTFGGHYVDTLTPLLGGCQPVPGSTIAALDAIDISHGVVPTSCRSYDAGQLIANITSTQTSLCLTGATPTAGMVGYLSHTADPVGNVEAIEITAVSTPGNCSTGSQVTVVRGYAGTTAGNYAANIDSWGCWSDVHPTGGAPNTALAAKTGYTIQAEAIAAAYKALIATEAP